MLWFCLTWKFWEKLTHCCACAHGVTLCLCEVDSVTFTAITWVMSVFLGVNKVPYQQTALYILGRSSNYMLHGIANHSFTGRSRQLIFMPCPSVPLCEYWWEHRSTIAKVTYLAYTLVIGSKFFISGLRSHLPTMPIILIATPLCHTLFGAFEHDTNTSTHTSINSSSVVLVCEGL